MIKQNYVYKIICWITNENAQTNSDTLDTTSFYSLARVFLVTMAGQITKIIIISTLYLHQLLFSSFVYFTFYYLQYCFNCLAQGKSNEGVKWVGITKETETFWLEIFKLFFLNIIFPQPPPPPPLCCFFCLLIIYF